MAKLTLGNPAQPQVEKTYSHLSEILLQQGTGKTTSEGNSFKEGLSQTIEIHGHEFFFLNTNLLKGKIHTQTLGA